MRITREQAEANRSRVLDSASRLFREKGFDGVGVAELMGAAGLTHGGFYNHFESKEDVGAAVCESVFARSVSAIAKIAAIEDQGERESAFVDYRRRYVSTKARDASAPSCPMVAFAGDMSRQSERLREIYARGLRGYLDAFVAASSSRDRRAALRRFAELAGTLTLARSVANADPELSDEILGALF